MKRSTLATLSSGVKSLFVRGFATIALWGLLPSFSLLNMHES